ncbi:MAG: SRPBCC domain-containing protein [Pseudomonadota bacterium]
MTRPTPVHSSFTIEREFAAPRELVFNAWTDPEAKANWFIGPDGWTETGRTFDARPGGVDTLRGRFQSGVETLYTARYHEIRSHDLIVYAYDMHIDGGHLSTSLSTVVLHADGDKTKQVYTEQAVHFDGEDGSISRQGGVGTLFEHLAAYLETMRSAA